MSRSRHASAIARGLSQALLETGFCDTEIEKILGLNMERVLRNSWR